MLSQQAGETLSNWGHFFGEQSIVHRSAGPPRIPLAKWPRINRLLPAAEVPAPIGLVCNQPTPATFTLWLSCAI